MSLPSAGWYADEQNLENERWWDGSAWTEHRRPRETAIPPAVPTANSAAPTSRAQREAAIKKNNPMAYAGLGFSVMGLILNPFVVPSTLGTIFAAIGLVKANQLLALGTAGHGKGFALAGVIIGPIGLAFTGFAALF